MEKKENNKQAELKNKTLKKFEEITEKNEELNIKIDKLKEKVEIKSKNLKKEVMEDIEDITDDIKDIKENLEEKSKELKKDIKEKTEKIIKNIKDNSKKFDKKDIEENKAMACLAYIMAPVPYFTETKSKWVRYHSIQGMNLFIIEVLLCLAVSIINSLILWPFWILKTILKVALYSFMVIYAVIGIINVCNEEAKELPIINKFKFIKK